jgi:hypothetical protein
LGRCFGACTGRALCRLRPSIRGCSTLVSARSGPNRFMHRKCVLDSASYGFVLRSCWWMPSCDRSHRGKRKNSLWNDCIHFGLRDGVCQGAAGLASSQLLTLWFGLACTQSLGCSCPCIARARRISSSPIQLWLDLSSLLGSHVVVAHRGAQASFTGVRTVSSRCDLDDATCRCHLSMQPVDTGKASDYAFRQPPRTGHRPRRTGRRTGTFDAHAVVLVVARAHLASLLLLAIEAGTRTACPASWVEPMPRQVGTAHGGRCLDSRHRWTAHQLVCCSAPVSRKALLA